MGKCKFLGEEKGTVECSTCGGRVSLKVFDCAVYGKCTLGKKAKEITGCCNGCPAFIDSVTNQARSPRLAQQPRFVPQDSTPEVWISNGHVVVNGAGQVRVCTHCPCIAGCCLSLLQGPPDCTQLGDSGFCCSGYITINWTDGTGPQTTAQDFNYTFGGPPGPIVLGTIIGSIFCPGGGITITLTGCDNGIFTISYSGPGFRGTATGTSVGIDTDGSCVTRHIVFKDPPVTTTGACFPSTGTVINSISITTSCVDVFTAWCPNQHLPVNLNYSMGTGTGDLAVLSGTSGVLTFLGGTGGAVLGGSFWSVTFPFTGGGSTTMTIVVESTFEVSGPQPWVTQFLPDGATCGFAPQVSTTGGSCGPPLNQVFNYTITPIGCVSGSITMTVSS